MSLTDTFIRNVKPASSPRKYFDGEGLFLYVPPRRLYFKKRGKGIFGAAIPARFSPAYPQRTRTRKR